MRVLGVLLGTALVLVTATTATGPAAAAPGGAGAPAGLTSLLRGERAVAAVRRQPAAVAAVNRMAPAEVVAALRRDETLGLARSGHLVVTDLNVPQRPRTAGRPGTDAPDYPLRSTFRLHSKPGSQRTIHLDFDGHVLAGTAWNGPDVPDGPQPPFDTDGRPSSWSPAELAVVQSVFRRVAEDFAPFDVDVTTQDPGQAALSRETKSDASYGTRVLISPSHEVHLAACSGTCGGVAFVGVFDQVDSTALQPAWVFSHVMFDDPKNIAEAASHEAGHTLGLLHHGTATAEYHPGNGVWAPIMGTGYTSPLVQWSSGDYPEASNPGQDDVAVMRTHGLRLRPDDHGLVPRRTSTLGRRTIALAGLVGARDDVDGFRIRTTCDGLLGVEVGLPAGSPNLDVRLRLATSSGAPLAEVDPPASADTHDAASGLTAALDVEATKGTYLVTVDGVGATSEAFAYSDYGSLGPYTVRVSACR